MYFYAMLHQPQLGIQSSLWTEECQLTRHALRYTFKLSIQRSYTCHNKVLQGLGKNFCYEKNVKNPSDGESTPKDSILRLLK